MNPLLLALGAMFLQQTFVALGRALPAVIAPAIITDLALDAAWVGVYFGLTASASLIAQLGCGSFIVRYGALRMSQALVPLMRKHRYGRVVNLSSGLGQLDEMGDGVSSYRVSKTALNALTRMLATAGADDNILVNSMCPGWVRTDMGGQNAERSVEKGAETAVWLAMLPHDGPSGGFFRDKKPIPW